MPAETYQRWADGACVCCGGNISEWENYRTGEVTEPAAIGEGVRICGRCIANDHLKPPDLIDAMLRAIVLRDDSPVDDLIASVRPSPAS